MEEHELPGHSARRSGAMMYVRAGLPLQEVAFLGRWKSNVVLMYAEGGPRDGGMGGPEHAIRMVVPEDAIYPFAFNSDAGHPSRQARSRSRLGRADGNLEVEGLVKGHGAQGLLHKGQHEEDAAPPRGKVELGHPFVEMENDVWIALCQRESGHGLRDATSLLHDEMQEVFGKPGKARRCPWGCC